MTHDEAIKALNTLVKNDNLKKHSIACGACMKALAIFLKTKHVGGFILFGLGSKKDIDENSWETVGLLHDADFERTKDRPVEHGPIIIDEVRSLGYIFSPAESEAIKFHNFENTHAKETLLGWAICICEQITGLIIACAQSTSDKKLSSVTTDLIVEKMKDAGFAKGVDRNKLNLSKEKIGMEQKDLFEISLEAMKSVASDLGL